MKILLVYPTPPRTRWPVGEFRSQWVPDGLGCMATVLRRAGHEIVLHLREEVLDKNGLNWAAADADFHRLLQDFQPQIVGFSVTTPCVPEMISLAAAVRETCGRHVLIVAGGPHPTALSEGILQECPDLDVVVIGEGELTLLELAEKGPGPSVAGIVYRDGEGFIHTPPRPLVHDLDSLGPPATDLLDMAYYTRQARWLIRYIPLRATNVRTSRGCTNRCWFCAGHLVSGLGSRFHSTEYVVEQVRQAADNWGVEAVRFEDDTLGGNRDRLLTLCEALRRAGLNRRVRWDAALRVDQADREVLAAMKAAGCIQIEFGLESGSTGSLGRLGKRSTADLNEQAVALTHEAGLRIFANIMVGLPGETLDDLETTVRFLRKIRPEIIVAGRLFPLPGTKIYDDLPEDVRRALRWEDYTYFTERHLPFNLTALPAADFEEWFSRFMKRVVRPYLSWSLFRDTPPEMADVRKRLRRNVAKFVLQHPLRAAKLPW
jgi:anaerobic magnesium-protoporphyrin IX monomethyl ester cyclase